MKNQSRFLLKNLKIFGLLLALLFLISAAGCNLPEFPLATPASPELVPSGEQNIQEALITFTVEVPADTPADEPILLSVLDEVTGLALNAKRYPMEKIDDSHYTLALPFKLGSSIKYRYSRSSEILAEEHTSVGSAVRYRLYHVLTPVKSMISSPGGMTRSLIVLQDGSPGR